MTPNSSVSVSPLPNLLQTYFPELFLFQEHDDKYGIEQIRSKLKEIGLNVGHADARRAARRTPGARGPMSTSQVPTNTLRGTTKSSFAASHPGSFRLRRTFKRPKGKVRKATKMHVHPCCRPRAQERPYHRTRDRIRDRDPEDRVQVEADPAAQW